MRVLDVQYKTAWLMTHRIREAMKSGNLQPMGGASGNQTIAGHSPSAPISAHARAIAVSASRP